MHNITSVVVGRGNKCYTHRAMYGFCWSLANWLLQLPASVSDSSKPGQATSLCVTIHRATQSSSGHQCINTGIRYQQISSNIHRITSNIYLCLEEYLTMLGLSCDITNRRTACTVISVYRFIKVYFNCVRQLKHVQKFICRIVWFVTHYCEKAYHFCISCVTVYRETYRKKYRHKQNGQGPAKNSHYFSTGIF